MSERQTEMFGRTQEELEKFFDSRPSYVSLEMMMGSMLSDAQELIELGEGDKARQHMNCVKWMLFTKVKITEAKEGK